MDDVPGAGPAWGGAAPGFLLEGRNDEREEAGGPALRGGLPVGRIGVPCQRIVRWVRGRL